MKLPKHIAIIMDGNGRWAQKRLHNRTFGHTKGSDVARDITRECAQLGIEALTLYTFSTENWQRPALEVNYLMKLMVKYLRNDSWELIENNIRFRPIGFLHMLPQEIQDELERVRKATEKNTGMFLNIALSYGSRQEMLNATKKIALDIKNQKISAEEITEELFNKYLFTAESPDPDLLIRTGGDKRISNYLLWQIAYAELYFTETCWPEFTIKDLHQAIDEFKNRERRYGKVLNSDEALIQSLN